MTDQPKFLAVTKAARNYGRAETNSSTSKAAVVAALKAIGAETDSLRDAFFTGFMGGALGLQAKDRDAKARAIIAKSGFATKRRANERRTERQETAYAAARQAWKRCRDAAGIRPKDQRGATSNPGKGKDAQTGDSKGKAPATMIPTAVSTKDAGAFLLAYVNKNATVFKGESGMALTRAVIAFAKEHAGK